MREIKFRGKCKIEKEFVYGDLIHGIGYKEGSIYVLPNETNLAYVKHCHPLDGVGVIPETIGQYTGFKDKDDKPLYEGDIVRDDENLCVVVFIEKWGMFSLILKEEYESYKLLGTESLDETMFFTFNISDRVFKLKGNIYDNEDLLQAIT